VLLFRCGSNKWGRVKLLHLPVALGTVVETRPVSCVREHRHQTDVIFLACCGPVVNMKLRSSRRSQSHFTTDGQSVIMSRYRTHSGTCDQILLYVRRLFSEICCLVFFGAPSLTRGRVCHLLLSVQSNLSVFTSSIYVTCVSQFSNLYTTNIKLQPSRLSTADYALLVILAQTSHRSLDT
jgi:hypothetical protein